jgi:hypothetical protein
VPTVYTTFEPTRALDVPEYEAKTLAAQGLLVPAPAAPAKTAKGGDQS